MGIGLGPMGVVGPGHGPQQTIDNWSQPGKARFFG